MKDWEWELWQQGPITDKLPIKWDETEFELNNYAPHCSVCSTMIEDTEAVHGSVERLNPVVVVIRSVSYCASCDVWTINHIRVRSTPQEGTSHAEYGC